MEMVILNTALNAVLIGLITIAVVLCLMGLGIAIMLIVRMQKIKKIKMEKIKRDEEREGK